MALELNMGVIFLTNVIKTFKFKTWCKSDKLHIQNSTDDFLPRDALQARPMPSCGVCLSVCLCVCVCVSVTFVHSVKTN